MRQNRSSEIYETIRQRIIAWEYPPNYRLIEETLCQEFGVSRVPVREALHMLEKHKLVTKIPYQGCRVQQPDLHEIQELYDVRLALELFVVEQLASAGMDAGIESALRGTWQALLAGEPSPDLTSSDYAQEDETFHEQLAQATGNRSLAGMLQEINERLSFVRFMDIQGVERLHTTCRQHLLILDCIRAGEVDAARTAMRTNITFGRGNVEVAIKDALSRAYLQQ
jgi:DNA-binding GntR family transcriptional regulator